MARVAKDPPRGTEKASALLFFTLHHSLRSFMCLPLDHNTVQLLHPPSRQSSRAAYLVLVLMVLAASQLSLPTLASVLQCVAVGHLYCGSPGSSKTLSPGTAHLTTVATLVRLGITWHLGSYRPVAWTRLDAV
eukprot:CAMPEP_0204266546 /NCGR_PEP_ID=MMETSP0468-20130131/10394_1 /ASSEMBLY_ACC=CAM_ASM_000383 /TAXON_ID=2969 /ORGANISM="Oxyrrhis marina" /LENGTH=132 /DNA_ID=CAMNT_0051241623 /DNA_START=23 /DNA_END=417 /DNA_ORIENTATION=+